MSTAIDLEILKIDKVICRHIEQFEASGRGAISQDILQNLRHFVEHIMVRIHSEVSIIRTIDYETIKSAIVYIQTRGEWKDIRLFHNFLQISVSHYVVDEESSERLMLK